MKVGYAQKEITPQIGVQLAGYANDQISNAIHDPLYARVLVFSAVPRDIIVVESDLVGIAEPLVVRLAERLQCERAQLFVTAIHTHSGPCGTISLPGLETIFGALDETYVQYWLTQCEKAYKDALKKSKESEIRYGVIEAPNIGSDRHDDSYGDNGLSVWEIMQSDGKKLLLYYFSCHPTIMNGENLAITADFPGAVAEEFKNEYQGVLFLNGSAGDISTRFTRKESSFAEVEAKGSQLTEYIRAALQEAKFVPLKEVKATFASFAMQIKQPADIATLQAKKEAQLRLMEEAKQRGADEKEIRVLYSVVEGYNSMIHASSLLDQMQGISLPVSFLKINDELLIGVPVELFSKLSALYKEKNRHVHFVSYCGGYYLYMVTRTAEEQQYYEANSCMFALGEGERFMEEVYQYAQEIKW